MPIFNKLFALFRPAGQGPRPGADRRNRSIAAFFATSLASRGVSVLVQLLIVPLALHHLGNEAFGLWLTLVGMSAMLAVADFGTGLGAQNRIAEAMGAGDAQQARRVFFTALAFLGAIAIGLALISVPICLWMNWVKLLKLHDAVAIEGVRPSALLLALACTGGIPLALSQRLAYGVQKGWLNNIAQILSSVITLGAVIAVSAAKLGLWAFVAANFLPLCIVNGLLLVGLVTHLKWWRGISTCFAASELKNLLNIGSLFFIQQVCAMTLFTLPSFILSATLGVVAVTPFNLGQRLFNLLAVVQNAFLLPIWPAYAEAKALGDWPWVRRTLRRSLLATLGLTVLPMAVATFFAHDLLRLWVGSKALLPSNTLVGLLFVWNAIVALQQPFGFLLAGMSEVRRVTVYSVCTVVTSIVLMVCLTQRLGVNGMVIGLIVAMACFSFAGSIWETRKFLRKTKAETAPLSPGMPAPDFV